MAVIVPEQTGDFVEAKLTIAGCVFDVLIDTGVSVNIPDLVVPQARVSLDEVAKRRFRQIGQHLPPNKINPAWF